MNKSDSIVVTGAYGFIGSRLVHFLNERGHNNIIVSDYLTNGRSFKSLNKAKYISYIHPDDLKDMLSNTIPERTHVFHMGAVSDTTCWDGDLVMQRNVRFSQELITYCVMEEIPITYASSASVYGNRDGPQNLYAYSKFLVDKIVDVMVEHVNLKSTLQGFRFFNVYGAGDDEQYKGDQASPYYKFQKQALETGRIEVFEGSENIFRDFISVDRVCDVMYRMAYTDKSGIFDLGTGTPKSFLQVAQEVAEWCKSAHGVDVEIVTIPFPEKLKGAYQYYTKADMSYLKDI